MAESDPQREVEELRRELARLQELNREFEAIFDSSYDEIYVTDGNLVTLKVSAACERLYGMKAEELIGRKVEDLVREGVFSPSCTALVMKERKRVTITQNTRSGRQIIVTGNPVFAEDGSIWRIIVNSRDVTELNNLKERLADTESLVDNYRMQLAELRQERLLKDLRVIAVSPEMKEVVEVAKRVAMVDSTVLILGETGVGKGVIASFIHQHSRRRQGPFITINCGAIPENLLESELFGYEHGAFTGARKEGKKGTIEMAHGGTLFLDEIAELPPTLQVKLLQVIQDRKVMRVGGNRPIDVDIRIIAATNRDIHQMVARGSFREDLFYRLNVVPVTIPPLRYRRDDIEPLINACMNRFNEKYEINKRLSPEALAFLINYDWPGNVRELENIVERLMVTCEQPEIQVQQLPDFIFSKHEGGKAPVVVRDVCSLKMAIEELEKQLITKAYQRYENTYRIAEVLEINQSTVVRKINKYLQTKKRKRGIKAK
ncbi:hypothetical protein SY88_15965 [Clostridiales bacterium PH28_bin88]|nr:hypothetical protein SY88_15965 [Clostridiales bacterium PH28_bin88]